MSLVFLAAIALPAPSFFKDGGAYVTVLGMTPRVALAPILLQMMLAQYLFKVAYEVVLTPATYAVVAAVKRKEGLDVYEACEPAWVKVTISQKPRGGITIVAEASLPDPAGPGDSWGRSPLRGRDSPKSE